MVLTTRLTGFTCVLKSPRNPAIDWAHQQPMSELSKEDKMKRRLFRVLLCAALLTPALAPRPAIAGEKELNAFNQYSKKDLKYHGEITAIDATAGTVTVKNKEKGPLTLTVTSGTLLFV